jgi:hypothetical protein
VLGLVTIAYVAINHAISEVCDPFPAARRTMLRCSNRVPRS